VHQAFDDESLYRILENRYESSPVWVGSGLTVLRRLARRRRGIAAFNLVDRANGSGRGIGNGTAAPEIQVPHKRARSRCIAATARKSIVHLLFLYKRAMRRREIRCQCRQRPYASGSKNSPCPASI
jgi:hypothetical protein